jgi:hypothetical protein
MLRAFRKAGVMLPTRRRKEAGRYPEENARIRMKAALEATEAHKKAATRLAAQMNRVDKSGKGSEIP